MLSTGLPSLDRVIQGVMAGDNIVWQVDAIEDYAAFVQPFYTDALSHGRRLIYFRFARHPPLVPDGVGAAIHHLSPELGFETFTAEIHRVIEHAGRGAFYVFDSLSDLAADWYSDLMLGNFFMVTCPYLFELQTVTYFALRRGHHLIDAVSAIRDTTQILIDVYRHHGALYIHPLKVDQRYSPTMYLPHRWDDGAFRPVTESALLADMLVPTAEGQVDSTSRIPDVWDRTFVHAREVWDAVRSGRRPPEDAAGVSAHLLRMMLTRDERVLALASRYFDLADLLAIRKRMIGTGLIGGKAVGMLLARAILCRTDASWRTKLETHDSFFIGSDVFYSFLVRNDCWRIRRNQRANASFLDGAEAAQQRLHAGTFPPFIHEQFVAMLGHFGQSPIIVRSSSLLEDGFGNAFTGKYESVFCPNQGSPEERLAAFVSAVRTVYASTMSTEALLYRARRGLLDSDEQMAVLVQRVSGAVYGDLFFPQAAGVGWSYNPYVWSEYIDPDAGVLRLVFGLGTRAVERADDDYTRIVALNAPQRRPEGSFDEVREYAQRRVDVINLKTNRLESLPSDAVLAAAPGLPTELFASPAAKGGGPHRDHPSAPGSWVLTFDNLLRRTPFVHDMRAMLQILRDAYAYPVDIEYTANFLSDGECRINLVQCRPFQVKEGGGIVAPPADLRPDEVALEALGTVVGQSSLTTIDRLIYVDPGAYGQLASSDRYSIARLIGRLTHIEDGMAHQKTVALVGPGRWGTSTPSLGVPVSFAEINAVAVLCEIAAIGSEVAPDVSLGTHFFNDLVESNMLYIAVYPTRKGNVLNTRLFAEQRNRLADLLEDDAVWADVVRVIDFPLADGRALYLNANCLTQRAVCYLALPSSA